MSKVDILKANKRFLKAKNKNILLFGSQYPIENFKIVCYNDSPSENLGDGGSNGRFIIYLVWENNTSSPKTWKSKKLSRVVKRAMAAEKLIQC